MQLLQRDDAGAQAHGAILQARLLEQREIVAAQLVAHDHVAQPGAEAVEQLLQQVHRIAAVVHHVPVVQGNALHVGQVQDA